MVTVVLCWGDGTWTEHGMDVPATLLKASWGRVLAWLQAEGPLGQPRYRKVAHAWVIGRTS